MAKRPRGLGSEHPILFPILSRPLSTVNGFLKVIVRSERTGGRTIVKSHLFEFLLQSILSQSGLAKMASEGPTFSRISTLRQKAGFSGLSDRFSSFQWQ